MLLASPRGRRTKGREGEVTSAKFEESVGMQKDKHSRGCCKKYIILIHVFKLHVVYEILESHWLA